MTSRQKAVAAAVDRRIERRLAAPYEKGKPFVGEASRGSKQVRCYVCGLERSVGGMLLMRAADGAQVHACRSCKT